MISRLRWVGATTLVAVAVVIPIVGLAVDSLRGSDIAAVWSRAGVREAVWFSLWQGAVSTIAAVVVGLAPAWALSRFDLPGRRIALTALTVPFVLPTVVVGAAFLAALPDRFDRSVLAIVLAHVFFNVSVVVRTVVPAWTAIDERLLDAARTLGASPLTVARTIVWPLLRPAVAGAAGLVFVMCATSYGVVRLLGGPGRSTLDVEIYRRAVDLADVSGATVLAVAQTLVIVALFALWSRSAARRASIATTRRRRAPVAVSVAVWTLVASFAVVPGALVVASFRSASGWSTAGWRAVFTGGDGLRVPVDVGDAIVNSVVFAVLAALVAVPLGVALARAAVSSSSRAADFVASLPLGSSAVVVGLGIIVTYDTGVFDVRGEWWLVPLVHAAVALPFVVRAIVPMVEAIPPGLAQAAATLGAAPWRRWFDIDLPLLRPAVATASAFSLTMSIGEFGATSFLTRRDTTTLPIVVDTLLGRAGSLPHMTAFAVASVLLVVTVLTVTAVDRSVRT